MRRGLFLALPLLFPACSTPPPPPPGPLEPPEVASLVDCYQGTPLSGPRAGTWSGRDPTAALRVRLTPVALERVPEGILRPLAGQQRLIASVGSGSALHAISHLAPGARAEVISSAYGLAQVLLAGGTGRAASMRQLEAALPAGVTARFRLERDAAADGLLPSHEALVLLVGRDEDGALDLGIGVEDARGADGQPRAELQLLGPFRGPRLELGLVLPVPFERCEARAIALLLSVEESPTPGQPGWAAHQEAFMRCLGDLARSAVLAEVRGARPAPALRPIPAGTLEGVCDPTRRRTCLLALAEGTGAALCADLALTGDEAALEAVAARVPAEGSVDGWRLERAAAAHLIGLAQEEEPPAWVESLLARHAGGLSLLPGTLLATLEADGLEAWLARLAAENRALLEEGWPALRLRAAEWLAARGKLPEGYDPLGPAAARAAALAASEGS